MHIEMCRKEKKQLEENIVQLNIWRTTNNSNCVSHCWRFAKQIKHR